MEVAALLTALVVVVAISPVLLTAQVLGSVATSIAWHLDIKRQRKEAYENLRADIEEFDQQCGPKGVV